MEFTVWELNFLMYLDTPQIEYVKLSLWKHFDKSLLSEYSINNPISIIIFMFSLCLFLLYFIQ